MKRFGLFLLVTMAAAIFTSCNDSDGDYPRLSAFASVKPLENNDFYVVLDDGKTVYPGDKSRIGSYKAEEDQRVVIYFNLLNNKVEGYDITELNFLTARDISFLMSLKTRSRH